MVVMLESSKTHVDSGDWGVDGVTVAVASEIRQGHPWC